MSVVEVTPAEAENIKHGKPFSPKSEQSPVAVFSGETLIAVMENNGGKWTYGCVLA
jgi:hypothetical protein